MNVSTTKKNERKLKDFFRAVNETVGIIKNKPKRRNKKKRKLKASHKRNISATLKGIKFTPMHALHRSEGMKGNKNAAGVKRTPESIQQAWATRRANKQQIAC